MNQKQIFELMEKFKECKLENLIIESEGFKISLRNGRSNLAPLVDQNTTAPAYLSENQQTNTVSKSKATLGLEISSEDSASNGEIIRAPIVGSFYRSPGPDSPPFVEEGSVVGVGEPICIIEAMKIMNKLEAEFSCEIIRILAESGQMVEYGAPLFEVRRA